MTTGLVRLEGSHSGKSERHLTPAQFAEILTAVRRERVDVQGFVISLTVEIAACADPWVPLWLAKRIGGDLKVRHFEDALGTAFWVMGERVYSPFIQRWDARPQARQPIGLSLRNLVVARDTAGGSWAARCSYCGDDCGDHFHIDHDLPVSRGGLNHPNNLCIACPPCNMSKSAMTGDEFREACL